MWADRSERGLKPGVNAPRLAKRLVAERELERLGPGLFYKPEKSRFGPLPPDDEKVLKKFLNSAEFLIAGPERWNTLGLGTRALFASTLVYNHKRTGEFLLGKRRFVLRRRAEFPLAPSAEWWVVDLFEHRAEAAAGAEELVRALAEAVARGALGKDRLRDAARNYATAATVALIEDAVKLAGDSNRTPADTKDKDDDQTPP